MVADFLGLTDDDFFGASGSSSLSKITVVPFLLGELTGNLVERSKSRT